LADRSSSNDSASSPTPRGAGPTDSGAKTAHDGETPGLGEQFGRTKSALFGLIRSHINLARAEFAEIAGEIKRAAALGGIALLLFFMAGILIVVGTLLFLGEAIFGSIGWGLLDGAELLIGAAALLILAIIDLGWRRGISAFVVALGVALVVAGLLAVDWSYVSHHYSGAPTSWILSVAVGAVLIGAVGAVLGSGFGRGPAIGAFVVGAICGLLLGLLAAAGPGPRVAAAMGVAALLLFWPIVAAYLVFRNGVDTAKLRARFLPEKTIETTKETIEWVREQMPLGRKS
jgi:uncharacterized membrane protein YqjE